MARRNQDLALTPSMPGTFLPLAHPTLVARPPSGVGWIHEIKFDGYRFQLNVQSGRATWFTRNGHDWTQKLPLPTLHFGRSWLPTPYAPEAVIQAILEASTDQRDRTPEALGEAIAARAASGS